MDLDHVDLAAEQLYNYATLHYNDNFGWSVIVECWDRYQIVQRLIEHKADSLEKAIAAFADLVDVWDDKYADAVNSAF